MRYIGVCMLLLIVIAVEGCNRDDARGEPPNTLTQRQRDSAIGASRIPGASGITRAMGAADSIAARNARLDSLDGQRR